MALPIVNEGDQKVFIDPAGQEHNLYFYIHQRFRVGTSHLSLHYDLFPEVLLSLINLSGEEGISKDELKTDLDNYCDTIDESQRAFGKNTNVTSLDPVLDYYIQSGRIVERDGRYISRHKLPE